MLYSISKHDPKYPAHGLTKDPSQQGFSLIEVLISMGIISLLTAVAYPAYNDYSARGRMADGVSVLSSLRLQTEQKYQETHSYAAANSPCTIAAPTNAYFTFVCSNVTATSYTWTATNKAAVGLGASSSYIYKVDESGTQTTTAYKGNTVAMNCWKTSKSHAC